MEVKTGVKIHNRFDIVVEDAITGEVIQKGQAENIVLNRIYDSLLSFNTYFVNIVFGTGSGTPTPERTTLFNRLGSKAATTDELIRAYPTSKWTRKIILGTEEFNGSTITEVGISETTTNINTHAMISDAEGNPLSIEKTNLRIVTIYATVFVEIYDVDTGLYWYANGLRDYLTGGSAPNNVLGISNLGTSEMATITGTRTSNSGEKSITVAGRFNVDALNKDVRLLYWTGTGLVCEVPRPGVFEGWQKTNEVVGVGDGVTTQFKLKRNPNTPLEDLAIMVDGVSVGFTYHTMNVVTLNTAPTVDSVITASYKSMYFPKDVDHVLDVSFKIGYGLGQPTPVVPPKEIGVPGSNIPFAGDSTYGFFGEVFADHLITGDGLASLIGLSVGTSQYSGEPWLKFALDGKILFVAKKPFRHTVSWDNINAVDAVFGDKTIILNGLTYKVRLLKSGLVNPMPNLAAACHGSEWNKLMLPIHIEAKDKTWAYPSNVEADVPYWGLDYTNKDLLTHNSFGNGSYSWCQETHSSYRVLRGGDGVSISGGNTSSSSVGFFGWRPVLELVP